MTEILWDGMPLWTVMFVAAGMSWSEWYRKKHGIVDKRDEEE